MAHPSVTLVADEPVDEDGWRRYFELVDTMQQVNRYNAAVRLMRIGYSLLYADALFAVANYATHGHTWVYIAQGVVAAVVAGAELVLLRIRYRLKR